MSGSEEVRNEMCRVGKVITVELKITDTDKALNLADTMFNGKSESGVLVHSWGLFDIQDAIKNRDEKIRAEISRHNDEMNYLMNDNNIRDFIKEQSND